MSVAWVIEHLKSKNNGTALANEGERGEDYEKSDHKAQPAFIPLVPLDDRGRARTTPTTTVISPPESSRAIATHLRTKLFIAAPMIKASDIAYRILCKRYGTDIAFSPMLYADLLVSSPSYREETLRTCAEDHPLIVQIAGSNKHKVLQAALHAQAAGAAAVDLNWGCPLREAKHRRFGSYMLECALDRNQVISVVAHVAANLDIPLTVKIRVLPRPTDTVLFARRLAAAGAAMITVHARQRGSHLQRRYGPVFMDIVRQIKEAVSIPVVVNGHVSCLDDALHNLQYTGADGVMSAEAILADPALFSLRGPTVWRHQLPVDTHVPADGILPDGRAVLTFLSRRHPLLPVQPGMCSCPRHQQQRSYDSLITPTPATAATAAVAAPVVTVSAESTHGATATHAASDTPTPTPFVGVAAVSHVDTATAPGGCPLPAGVFDVEGLLLPEPDDGFEYEYHDGRDTYFTDKCLPGLLRWRRRVLGLPELPVVEGMVGSEAGAGDEEESTEASGQTTGYAVSPRACHLAPFSDTRSSPPLVHAHTSAAPIAACSASTAHALSPCVVPPAPTDKAHAVSAPPPAPLSASLVSIATAAGVSVQDAVVHVPARQCGVSRALEYVVLAKQWDVPALWVRNHVRYMATDELVRVQCRDALETTTTIKEVEAVALLAQERLANGYQFDSHLQQKFREQRANIVRARRRREERQVMRAKKRLRRNAHAEQQQQQREELQDEGTIDHAGEDRCQVSPASPTASAASPSIEDCRDSGGPL